MLGEFMGARKLIWASQANLCWRQIALVVADASLQVIPPMPPLHDEMEPHPTLCAWQALAAQCIAGHHCRRAPYGGEGSS